VEKIHDVFSSFLTIPNAFRQCTITLLIIHSAIFEDLKEKLPGSPFIYTGLAKVKSAPPARNK